MSKKVEIDLGAHYDASQEIINTVATHHGKLPASVLSRYVDCAAQHQYNSVVTGGLLLLCSQLLEHLAEHAEPDDSRLREHMSVLEAWVSVFEESQTRGREALGRWLVHSLSLSIGCRTKEEALKEDAIKRVRELIDFATAARSTVIDAMTKQAAAILDPDARGGDKP